LVEVDWAREEQRFQSRIAEVGATPTLSLCNEAGTVLLAHSQFDAFEGEYEDAPYLFLTLCTAHIGRIGRYADEGRMEGVMRPGTVAIALPNTKAYGFWPKAHMFGIGIDLSAFSDRPDGPISVERLLPAASILHRDPLLSAVMTAIWRDAELHGLSTAFFEHAIAVVLDRLVSHNGVPTDQPASKPLSRARLKAVIDLVESRIGSDIRTSEMAIIARQDERGFCRSFRAATGLAPHEFVTTRRIEKAKQLMLAGSSVTNAALSVGYANPSKFAAAFRRICGETPTIWRRTQCHDNRTSFLGGLDEPLA
jgi:AraC family transcriptional regulator